MSVDTETKLDAVRTQNGWHLSYEGASVNVIATHGEFVVEGLQSDGKNPHAVIALMIAVEAFAVNHGYEQIHIYHTGSARDEDMGEAEKRLYRFYRKHGFTPSYTIITKELN